MTDSPTISCPTCGAKIPLNDALTHDLKERLSVELNAPIKRKEAELATKERQLEEQYEKKMEQERVHLQDVATRKAREEMGTKVKDLEQAYADKDQKLKEAEGRELDLMKRQRALEEKERTMELEVERKLAQERKKIEGDAQNKASEEYRLQIMAKDEQMDQMRKTIDDLKRRSEQGSMQIQGEVQEDSLKIDLCTAFPEDTIVDIPKGICGADLQQTVRTRSNFCAGTMIWESKNTKNWGGDWIKKLKDDQVEAKADLCIIVSQVLPEGVKGFGVVEGVWVTDLSHALPLAHALRHQLLQLAQVKASLVGKDEKMEILYKYLTSPQFKNRMENIVNAFICMQQDLESEKRAMQKHWKKREKEVERVIENTTGMYGDFQGLIGAALPTISSLELPSGDEEETENQ